MVLSPMIPDWYCYGMKYPNRIREIREPTGINVTQLAKMIGTSQPQMKRLEDGDREITPTWMFKIARALKCDPAALMPTDPLGDRTLPVRRIGVLGAVKAGLFRPALEWPPEDRYYYDATVDPAYRAVPVFGLRVDGPSMDEVFPDGSEVECVKLFDLGEDFELESGTYVVVMRHDPDGSDRWEATIKEYVVDQSGVQWLWPRSSAPEFQSPWPFASLGHGGDEHQDDGIYIWAVVIGHHKKMKVRLRPNGD